MSWYELLIASVNFQRRLFRINLGSTNACYNCNYETSRGQATLRVRYVLLQLTISSLKIELAIAGGRLTDR